MMELSKNSSYPLSSKTTYNRRYHTCVKADLQSFQREGSQTTTTTDDIDDEFDELPEFPFEGRK